jgi:hypothetical protein
MLCVYVLSVALQLHSMFSVHDVKHLMVPRMLKLQLRASLYGDVEGFGKIVPAKVPDRVAVASVADKMHFFLHDTERIRRCMWDGAVSLDDKKSIATSLVEWLESVNVSTAHLIYDHEDGSVFAEVTNSTAR